MKRESLISPQLFDLSQDIVTYLPPELIEKWLKSDRSEETARQLLETTKVRGTLVCTDTAGLSKLTQKLDVIEVMAYLNQPKELIYSYGKAIGGKGIGLWAADNTTMFYDESIDPHKIISMLQKVRDEIAKKCKVQVGFGVHFGEFRMIGHSIYGNEADYIEEIAENETQGGEIVITSAFRQKLDTNFVKDAERVDLKSSKGQIFSIESVKKMPLKPSDRDYPIPFSKEFHRDIRILSRKGYEKTVLYELRKKYIQNKVVVLIERSRNVPDNRERELLNDFALYAAMSKIAVKLLYDFEGKRIKTIGNLGIYIFSDAQEALDFSHAFKALLRKEYALKSRIGIASGEVLVFTLADETKEIAGGPVNVASKLAQDKGEFGRIYISEEIFTGINPSGFELKEIEASGVTIKSYVSV